MKSLPNLESKHIAIALGFGALSTLIASWGEMGLMMDTAPLLLPFLNEDPTPMAILISEAHSATVIDILVPYSVFRKTDCPNMSVPNIFSELGGA